MPVSVTFPTSSDSVRVVSMGREQLRRRLLQWWAGCAVAMLLGLGPALARDAAPLARGLAGRRAASAATAPVVGRRGRRDAPGPRPGDGPRRGTVRRRAGGQPRRAS